MQRSGGCGDIGQVRRARAARPFTESVRVKDVPQPLVRARFGEHPQIVLGDVGVSADVALNRQLIRPPSCIAFGDRAGEQ